jgi:hypothetical protein
MSEPNLKELDAVFNNFGPTPRLCFNTLLRPCGIDSHKRALNVILAGLTSQDLKSLVGNMGSLAADKLSHKICLISRNNRDEISDETHYKICRIATCRLSSEPADQGSD